MENKKYDIIDVYFTAGKRLSRTMKELDFFWGDDQELVDWFYRPNDMLGMSPNQYCLGGRDKKSHLESILLSIAVGAGGS